VVVVVSVQVVVAAVSNHPGLKQSNSRWNQIRLANQTQNRETDEAVERQVEQHLLQRKSQDRFRHQRPESSVDS
jgi:hypothetical protein